jgi:hypothetical protein
MPEYIPSPRDWVREQVELYERTNGRRQHAARYRIAGHHRDSHRQQDRRHS